MHDSVSVNINKDDSSVAKTQKLGKLYANLAKEEYCEFLDAASIVKISNIDGVHFERDSHKDLANAIAKKIIGMK